MKLFAVFILVVSLVGCDHQPTTYPARNLPFEMMDSPSALSIGAALFAEKCASCHGHSSEGRSERAAFFQPPAPVFSEARYRDVDPAYLYWRIATGKNAEPFRSRGSVMPAWGAHLAEEDIWRLVLYLQSRAIDSD